MVPLCDIHIIMITIFFFHSFSITKPDELPFKIGIGGINTLQNPFSSLRLPGIHSCKNKENISTIYSYTERRALLNFQNYKISEDTYQIMHCTIKLKSNDLVYWNNNAKEDSFLRFYVGEHAKRVFILDPMVTTQKYIFNDFLITIDDEFSDKHPRFLVQPSNSVKLPFVKDEEESMEMNLSFKFSLNFVHFDRTESQEPNYFIFATLGVIVTSIITTYIIINIYKRKFPSITMPQYASIWKIPFFISNTLLFSTAGLILLFSLIFVYVFADPSNLVQTCFNSIFISSTMAIIIRIKVGFIYQRITSEVDFISPSLFAIGGCPLAYQIVNIANRILFNADRGYPVMKNFFTVFGCMMTLFFFLRGIGFGFEIINPIDINNFIFKRQKKAKAHIESILIPLLFGIISTVLLRPIIDHLYFVLLDDSDIDILMIIMNVIVFSTVSAIVSLYQTTRRVKSLKATWQEDHIFLSGCVSLFAIIYCLYLVFIDRGIRNFVAFCYCVSCGIAIVTAISTIGCAASYFMALIFVKYTISFPQVN